MAKFDLTPEKIKSIRVEIEIWQKTVLDKYIQALITTRDNFSKIDDDFEFLIDFVEYLEDEI